MSTLKRRMTRVGNRIGVWMYRTLDGRQVLANPSHPEHAAMRAWVRPQREFDQAGHRRRGRQAVGEVPATVRLVLTPAADGVKLTPGGRLPRWFVRRVQEDRPDWHPPGTPASIEEDLYPLFERHGLFRQVGLLRPRSGVLRPTRAAADDLEVVRRLRSWFASDAFTDVLAGSAVAILATAGPQLSEDLAAAVLPMLGHRWSRAGRPLVADDVHTALAPLGPVRTVLDLLEIEWRRWGPGPSARTLLPRAAALAHLWSHHPDRLDAAVGDSEA